MNGTIGDWKPVLDWFNAVTSGFIIGWWMRAIYGWATGHGSDNRDRAGNDRNENRK